MRIRVVCIGSELLLGRTLNSNLAFLGRALDALGYRIDQEVCVPDTADAIRRAVTDFLQYADVVLTVGGLGPTSDDITRSTIAEALGLPLVFDESLFADLKQKPTDRGEAMSAEAQARVPRGARVLPNLAGVAPGLWCEKDGRQIIMLPGPPGELQPMFTDSVAPLLQQEYPPEQQTRTIRTAGVPEVILAEQVEDFCRSYPAVCPAYCARPGLVDIRLGAAAGAVKELRHAADELARRLGSSVLPEGKSLAEAVGQLLKEHGLTLATAESCTGGGIAAALTDTPGASAYFLGGLVTYANEWKQSLLGVRDETLMQFGAVSQETADEMLDGLRRRYKVDAGITVTGIAGPEGGSAAKPVGLVFIGTMVGNRRRVERYCFSSDRDGVRARAVAYALNQLRLDLLTGRSE